MSAGKCSSGSLLLISCGTLLIADGDAGSDAVPTIRSLKIAGDGSIDPGESPDTDPLEPHLENNESIDAAQDVQFRKMLTAQLRKALPVEAEGEMRHATGRACFLSYLRPARG